MSANKWIQLASLPDGFALHRVININQNEFILTNNSAKYPFQDIDQTKYPYKYNMIKNSFIQCMKYSPTYDHQIAFNKTKQEIYFKGRQIHTISGKTKQHSFTNIVPEGEYFLFINNYFHIFGINDKHWICTKTENEKIISIQQKGAKTRRDGSAIYISSKQSILLIGGCDGEGALVDDVWIYSLSLQKWRKVDNISFRGHGFSAVLTSNQEKVILFGGINDRTKDDDVTNDIFVLDIKHDNNWKIKRSKICCPDIGQCHIAITGGIKDEMLVIGFVKQCFKRKEFQCLQLPPVYIIMLIANRYSAEMIHWLKDGNHYGMYLQHIVEALDD